MNYTIFDNFLNQQDSDRIKDTMLGTNFPWYFQQGVSYKQGYGEDYLNNFQFTHLFWNSTDSMNRSHFFDIVQPLIDRINPIAVLRIKANLIPVTTERIVHQLHVDVEIPCKTAVYYVNTNNGATIFEDGSETSSLQNRLVVFDSQLQHTSCTCTDKKARCVININYF